MALLLSELTKSTPLPLLEELKAAGKPLQWHVYPEATHAWDKPGLSSRGYVYDAQTTQDATARMIAFFAEAR